MKHNKLKLKSTKDKGFSPADNASIVFLVFFWMLFLAVVAAFIIAGIKVFTEGQWLK